jgi:hypothetical protein
VKRTGTGTTAASVPLYISAWSAIAVVVVVLAPHLLVRPRLQHQASVLEVVAVDRFQLLGRTHAVDLQQAAARAARWRSRNSSGAMPSRLAQ